MARFACCSRRRSSIPNPSMIQKWMKLVERVLEKQHASLQLAIHHPRVIKEIRERQRFIDGEASPEVLSSLRRLARWEKFILRFRRIQKIRRDFAIKGFYLKERVHPSIRAALKRAYPPANALRNFE